MENKERYVTLKVFTWAIGFILIVIGWILTADQALSAKVDSISDNYVSIETQLSQIQTDLVWIKNNVK